MPPLLPAALAAGVVAAAAERFAEAASGNPALSLSALMVLAGALMATASVAVTPVLVVSEVLGRLANSARAALAASASSGVLFASLVWPAARDLGSGDWASQQAWAAGLPVLVAVACGVGAAVATAAFLHAEHWPRRFAGLAAAGGLALLVADQMFLPRLYEGAHLILILAGTLLVSMALARPFDVQRRVWTMGAAVVAIVGAVAWYAAPMPVRAELALGSTRSTYLASFTLPPLQLGAIEERLARIDVNAGGDTAATTSVPTKRWNVLWVVVDTLRADALWPNRVNSKFARDGDTPVLDRWLAGATVFQRAYAQGSSTKVSMPPMFRSLETWEDPMVVGAPLGEVAGRDGRQSIAVVNNLFLEPRRKQTQALLDGFEVVSVYEKREQHRLVPLAREAIRGAKDRGFFAWVHFYNMHAPGYDGRLLPEKGSPTGAYRKSLRWMDRNFGALMTMLSKEGLSENTIVVFSADHGEALGQHGHQRHGPTVFEPEVRVPLAIHVPGMSPRVVPQTVGNIDIVPTLYDLLGWEAEPTHRGRSLVPALQGRGLRDAAYYMENLGSKRRAVILGTQKLIVDDKSGAVLRFDVAVDPNEEDNLYTGGPPDDALLVAMSERNPATVEATPAMRRLALAKLHEFDGSTPTPRLLWLANLASSKASSAAFQALERIWAGADARLRLALLPSLQRASPDATVALVATWLEQTPASQRGQLARSLAGAGYFGLGVGPAVEGLRADGASDEGWFVYLAAVGRDDVAHEALGSAITRSGAGCDEVALAAARAVAAQRPPTTEAHRAVSGWLSCSEPRVRAMAARAAAGTRALRAVPALRNLLREGGLRERQAALHALVELDPEGSTELIIAAASDPILVLDVLQACTKLANPPAVEFLESTSKSHYNPLIRLRAKQALKKLKK